MVRRLELAVADRELAADLVGRALARGSKSAVLSFARTSLTSVLAASLGEATALQFAEAVTAALEEAEILPEKVHAGPPSRPAPGPTLGDGEAVPASAMRRSSGVRIRQPSDGAGRPLLVLLLHDPVERPRVARQLIRDGVDVCSSESVPELLELLEDQGPHPHLAVVDLRRHDALSLLTALGEVHPGLPIVACGKDAETASRTLSLTPLVLVHVHPDGAPLQELTEYVLRHAAEPREDATPPRPPLNGVPRLRVTYSDLSWFDLDADALRFAEAVDGRRDLGALASLCGLDPVDARALAQSLGDKGVLQVSHDAVSSSYTIPPAPHAAQGAATAYQRMSAGEAASAATSNPTDT